MRLNFENKIMGKALLTLLFAAAEVFAAQNTVFRGRQNQFTLAIGQSTGYSAPFKILSNPWYEPLRSFTLKYSQPTELFRLPSRVSLEFGYHLGDGKVRSLTQQIFGVSWDIVPLSIDSFYVGGTFGGYVKAKVDERIDSRVLFGERLFVGYVFREFSLELYLQHYSNGDVTGINHGQNFTGVSISHSF
jgi:hypothetical protein